MAYSSPLTSAHTITGIRNRVGYRSCKWSTEDLPLLKGLQRSMISWAPSGPGAKTSSIGGAEPHGGRYKFKSSRSGSRGLLRSARIYRGLSGLPKAYSGGWITWIAAGVGKASTNSTKVAFSRSGWSFEPISGESEINIAYISGPSAPATSRMASTTRLNLVSCFRFRTTKL